jgi:isochorismate hydrolase
VRAQDNTLELALLSFQKIIRKIMKMQRPCTLSVEGFHFCFWLKGFCLQPIHFHREKRAVIKTKWKPSLISQKSESSKMWADAVPENTRKHLQPLELAAIFKQGRR